MSADPALPTQYLPDGLRRIAEYCGWEIMWKLWENYAGSRIAVPARIEPEHPLAVLLSLPNALSLCQAFGGELINIPKADAAKRAVRDAALRTDYRLGVEMHVLVQRYNLSYRQIQTICRDEKPATNTDLFNDFLTEGEIHEP